MHSYIKGELIGTQIKIIDSRNKSLIGVEGKIVDETKNTILLSTKKGEKKIIKDQVEFDICEGNKIIKIEGKNIIGRSEERIKKRIK